MKNLELEGFGLVEMETDDQKAINGGGVWAILVPFVVGAWIADSLLNYSSSVEHFKKGWNSVK